MTIWEAAERVLSILEQTDEEEYDMGDAMRDVSQSIGEIAGESELSEFNQFSEFEIDPDNYNTSNYWTIVPGRAPLNTVLGTDWPTAGYIKKAWLATAADGVLPFKEMDLRAMLDKYADDEGTPEVYAVDGSYMYWRPIGPTGSTYTSRLHWISNPQSEYISGDEPRMLAQKPYAVIYRACALACMWTVDDDRAIRFDKMAQRLIDQYVIQDSMHGDSRIEMEEYNG